MLRCATLINLPWCCGWWGRTGPDIRPTKWKLKISQVLSPWQPADSQVLWNEKYHVFKSEIKLVGVCQPGRTVMGHLKNLALGWTCFMRYLARHLFTQLKSAPSRPPATPIRTKKARSTAVHRWQFLSPSTHWTNKGGRLWRVPPTAHHTPFNNRLQPSMATAQTSKDLVQPLTLN